MFLINSFLFFVHVVLKSLTFLRSEGASTKEIAKISYHWRLSPKFGSLAFRTKPIIGSKWAIMGRCRII